MKRKVLTAGASRANIPGIKALWTLRASALQIILPGRQRGPAPQGARGVFPICKRNLTDTRTKVGIQKMLLLWTCNFRPSHALAERLVSVQVDELLNLVRNACKEVQESADLAALLKGVLIFGNVLNSGTDCGSAAGFKLGSLLKLTSVKAVDREMALSCFLSEEHKAEEPLRAVLAVAILLEKAAAGIQL